VEPAEAPERDAAVRVENDLFGFEPRALQASVLGVADRDARAARVFFSDHTKPR
jgi:hypothetical protein